MVCQSRRLHLVAVLCEHHQVRVLLLDGTHHLVKPSAQAIMCQRLLQHVCQAPVQVWLAACCWGLSCHGLLLSAQPDF